MIDVSVIIPTYNGENNIYKTVTSIFEQSFKNFEVIVVDDNGEGTSKQVETEKALSEYLDNDNFIYIKHKKNSGGSAARNTGAKISKGKYLIFLDDDDSLSNDNIGKQFECMERQNENIAFSYSSSKIYIQDVFSNEIRAKQSGSILYQYLMGEIFIGTGTFLLRKSVWEELDGYDESFVRHQDWEFLARVLDRYNAVTVPDVYFERHIINRNLPVNIQQAEKYSDYFIEFLKREIHSISDKKIRNVVNLNNSRIAIKYLRNKEFKVFFKTMRKYDNFFAAYISLFRLIIKHLYNCITNKKT